MVLLMVLLVGTFKVVGLLWVPDRGIQIATRLES